MEIETVKSTEQKLQEVKEKAARIREQLIQPDSILRSIYNTNSPKKDAIVTWAEALEEEVGYEHELKIEPIVEEVGQIANYIIDEMQDMGLNKTTYTYEYKVLGHKYKNPSKSHSRKQENIWSTESTKNSSKPIANYELENESFIETINREIHFLKNLRTKAKTTRILSGLTSNERLKYEEINLRTQATQLIAEQIIDDRQSVPTLAQLKLVMSVVGATNNSAASMYVTQIKKFGANKMEESQNFFIATSRVVMKYFSDKDKQLFTDTFKNIRILRKKITKMDEKIKKANVAGVKDNAKPDDFLTSKQGMKIVYGLVKNVLPVFDHRLGEGHNDRDAALMDDNYGLACPECGSYRVRERPYPDGGEWLCFCYKCEWWFEAKTVSKCWGCHLPLFDDILAVILKTAKPILNPKKEATGALEGSCPRCEKPIILPAKMFKITKLRGQ